MIKDIFCQDKVINALERAYFAGRMPHAYIFAGPEGVGKYTTARELAKVLLCKKPVIGDAWPRSASGHATHPEDHGQDARATSGQATPNKCIDSCGKCESCTLADAGSHPDLNLVYKELLPFTRDGKNRTASPVDLPIDVIREFLIEKAPSKPAISERTVFIIQDAHKLNNASQNALLKVLEEPPAFCTIILLCTRLEKLLPTTQSRCQVLTFGPIDETIIVDKLKGNQIPTEEARFWARFAQGSLGTAVSWASLGREIDEGDSRVVPTNEAIARAPKRKTGGSRPATTMGEDDGQPTEQISAYKIKCGIVDKLASIKLTETVEFAEVLSKLASVLAGAWEDAEKTTSKSDLSRRALKGVIQMVAAALNDAMKISVEPQARLINADQEAQIRALSRKFDAETAAAKVGAAYKSMEWVDSSVNEKLILEDLLLNLA